MCFFPVTPWSWSIRLQVHVEALSRSKVKNYSYSRWTFKPKVVVNIWPGSHQTALKKASPDMCNLWRGGGRSCLSELFEFQPWRRKTENHLKVFFFFCCCCCCCCSCSSCSCCCFTCFTTSSNSFNFPQISLSMCVFGSTIFNQGKWRSCICGRDSGATRWALYMVSREVTRQMSGDFGAFFPGKNMQKLIHIQDGLCQKFRCVWCVCVDGSWW